MINRIGMKSNNIGISSNHLFIGNEGSFQIPLSKINCIEFYPPTEIEAGYLVIVKNDCEDADIVFFHRKFEMHFKKISNEVKDHIYLEPIDIY